MLTFVFALLLVAAAVNADTKYGNPAYNNQNPTGGNGYYSYQNPGFSVQSGYEGYLVPTGDSSGLFSLLNTPGMADTKLEPAAAETGISILGLLSLLPLGLKLHVKFMFVLGALFLLFLGSVATAAVCRFTPLCSITFPFLRRREFQSLLSSESLNELTGFVTKAIDKYNKIQNKSVTSMNEVDSTKEEIESNETD